MSDKTRCIIGMLLLLGSLMLCISPAIIANTEKQEDFFPNGIQPYLTFHPISTEKNGTIRINESEQDELTELHGIGETLAALIVAERNKNGLFYYPEDLESVKGIGSRTLEKFREQIDLSTEESRE